MSGSSRRRRISGTGSTSTMRRQPELWLGLPQEGDRTAERRLVTGRRRGALRRLDRRDPEEGRRGDARAALHAPAEGQQLERDQRRQGRAADGRGPDAAGRPGGVRRAYRTRTRRSTLTRGRDRPDRRRDRALPGRRRGLGGLAGALAVVSADGHPLGHEREAGRDARAAARRAHRRFAGRAWRSGRCAPRAPPVADRDHGSGGGHARGARRRHRTAGGARPRRRLRAAGRRGDRRQPGFTGWSCPPPPAGSVPG